MKITQERLKEILTYDPESGSFVWKIKRRGMRARVGDLAGSVDKDGYWQISVDGHLYRAHRLAWLYMTGQWPELGIDHRDCDRTNNRWLNLREADHFQNVFNRRGYSSSGFKGVSWDKVRQRWKSRITAHGRTYFLGYFDSAELAHLAFKSAVKSLHGEFAHT